jgi:1-phosphofructokinase
VIYTVTLNPALDKTVEIPNFTLGEVNRVQNLRTDAGGKGINVSKCIATLEGKSTALAVLAGEVGKGIFAFLEQQPEIVPLTVWAAGETRTNLKIIDPAQKTNTDINERGPIICEKDLNSLLELLLNRIEPGDEVIFAGSLPSGTPASLYRDWTRICKQHGAKILLDADREALQLGVEAKPALIKPNQEELSALVGRPLLDEKDVLDAARAVASDGIERVVVSMGSKGALFFSKEKVLRASALKVPVRSTVGAGDSMVAALAYGMQENMSWEDQARLAIAFSNASVMCSGTQAPSLETVKKLSEQVNIMEVSQ